MEGLACLCATTLKPTFQAALDAGGSLKWCKCLKTFERFELLESLDTLELREGRRARLNEACL